MNFLLKQNSKKIIKKIVQFFLIINEKIKEMVNNCNLRSSSSIVYPVTINIRLESNDGIPSNGNGNVVRKEREKVSIIEIDSIPTLWPSGRYLRKKLFDKKTIIHSIQQEKKQQPKVKKWKELMFHRVIILIWFYVEHVHIDKTY